MSGIIERFFKNYCPICKMDESKGGDTTYSVFRILFGLMFLQHGLQKIFGAFGGAGGSGTSVEFGTLIFWAGLIELIVGAGVTFGLFTRAFSLLAVIEMAYAYFAVHLSKGFYPILNGGELVVLFFAAFLLMLKHGNGKWSLERIIFEKEIF